MQFYFILLAYLLVGTPSAAGQRGPWATQGGSPRAITHSPTQDLLATAGTDNTIALWNTVTFALTASLWVRNTIRALAFSPNGTILASAARLAPRIGLATIIFWDMDNATEIGKMQQHMDQIFDINFSPDGLMLASSAGDMTIRLFCVPTGALVLTIIWNVRFRRV